MSDHQHNDTPDDGRLSAAYRDLSTEQTSEQLDRKILNMAAEGAPKKSLTRLLAIKPLAWAATLVLTVALVTQLQDIQPPETLIFEDEVAPRATVPLPRKDSDQGAASSMKAQLQGAAPEPAADAALESTAASARDLAIEVQQSPDQDSTADFSSFAPAQGARVTLEKVEELVVEQEAVNLTLRESAEPAVSVERKRMKTPPEPRYCDATKTSDATSWYQCILDLEKEGKLEQAAAERTRLFSEHPDFKVR